MRLPRWSAALTVAVSLLGTASATNAQTGNSERTKIDVRLPVPKAAAYDRVMNALLSEDLVAAQSSQEGGLIVTQPTEVSRLGFKGAIYYRANVVAADSGSRVVLTAWMKNSSGKELFQSMTRAESQDQDSQITAKWRGEGKKAWERLERIAASLAPADTTK